jgi:hypothetical protein
MNIVISAVRTISFTVRGEERVELQRIYAPVEQTPTTVTEAILASANPLEAYKNWLRSRYNFDTRVPIYAEADIFCEDEPVSYNSYNVGERLVAELEEWIKAAEDQGYYTLEIYSQ